ncbi:MAG: ketoacyl-ACP synthase III [Polyangiales bacterium]
MSDSELPTASSPSVPPTFPRTYGGGRVGPPASRILGTGRYTPERRLTNADLEKLVDTSDAWIIERTGIKERRVAAPGELTSDMAAAAGRRAIEAAGLTADDIDMIVVGTISGDMPMPACAAFVQQKIGAKHCPAFDISAACAGFVYGITIADRFIRAGGVRNVLVIGVELLSRLLDWEDRKTCVLVGDGAGAVVVGPNTAPDPTGPGAADRGILSTHLFTDGALACSLFIPGGGSKEPVSAEVLANKRHLVHMEGQDVFKAAVRNLSSAANAALAANGITAKDVDWVVAHQANLRILQAISQRLEIPMERFYVNIQKYGNTSSASIPIALDELIAERRVAPGQTILMTALGAGISWGSALIRW